MKKTVIIIISAIALAGFILGTCYAWYNVFLKENITVTNLEIRLNDEGKGISVEDMTPLSDDEIDSVPAYVFSIKNTGTAVGSYNLLLEETALNKLEDGCTEITLLTRDQLRYSLSLNGKEVSRGMLSDIKNNILDFRTIDVGTNNNYSLKIWLPESVRDTAWEGKHYHYHVAIVPITEGEE